jgi:DNA-binding NtrC family response regulator
MPATGRTILIVDDDADIVASLADLLEAGVPRARILTASSGREAIALLGSERVDLVVSDFRMPGMDGLTFLDTVDAPRIMITAYPDFDLAVKAIGETRVEAFLTKPLDPGEVVDVVTAVLDGTWDPQKRSGAIQRSMADVWRHGTYAGG